MKSINDKKNKANNGSVYVCQLEINDFIIVFF